jgi:diacylglycerol kinase family enzyme
MSFQHADITKASVKSGRRIRAEEFGWNHEGRKRRVFRVNLDLPPVVINGQAGTVRADVPDAIEDVHDQIADRAVLDRMQPDDVEQRVREHLKGGAARIAVGGGDGTLAAFADLISRERPDTELACLPLVTHNHFAKDVGVPLDPLQWPDALASSSVRRVDLSEANGRLFLNNLSIGLYPVLVEQRQNLADERLLGSKRLTTLAAADDQQQSVCR